MKMSALVIGTYFTLLCLHFAVGFYRPECEYAGMSCLDCYTQKMCINLWGLVHWSDSPCANSIAGDSEPYCNPDTDQCTNVRPEGCSTISLVKCLRDDIFPDASDCQTYYKCSNSTGQSYTCPKNYVYRQEFGKCVFKLADADCVELSSCGLEDYVAQYPGDASLYYGCQDSKFYFDSCSPTEFFNTTSETCENICNYVGLLPKSQDCTKYYDCQETDEYGLVAVEESCPDGYGFNPYSLTCENRLSAICNEFAILENNKYTFISKIPIIGKFTHIYKKILNLLNLSPAQVVFIFRLSDEDISTLILVMDYIYQNRRLPSTSLSVLLNFILNNLPAQFQFILNILQQFGIINLRSVKSIEDTSLQNILKSILSTLEIDFATLFNNFEGGNSSAITRMPQGTFKILKKPEIFLLTILKDYLPFIVYQVNDFLGRPIFTTERSAELKINTNVIDDVADGILKFIVSRLFKHNDFDAKVFMLNGKQQYLIHRDDIIEFIESFRLDLSTL